VSKGKRFAFGFFAAALIGGGGGYALGPVADSLAAEEARSKLASTGSRGLRLEEIEGDVRVLGPDGGFVAARAGEETPRPTCLEAKGALSTVRAKIGATQLSAGHHARVVIGENDGAIQLDRGQVKVSGTRVSTYVPAQQMKVTGTSYGVWADEDRVVVAVIEGEVEVAHRGDTAKYSGGREIVYDGKTITPRALDPQLALQIVDEQKGADRRITASTSPAAFVFRKIETGYERVTIPASGKFTVTLAGREPSAGELVAFDAAGRSAHLGGAPEVVKAVLGGEAKKEEAVEAVPPPAPAPQPAPVAKAEEKPAKAEKKAKKRKVAAKKPPRARPELTKEEAAAPRLEGREEDGLPPPDETFVPEFESDEAPTLQPLNDDEKVD
jgi:hypothetical protein